MKIIKPKKYNSGLNGKSIFKKKLSFNMEKIMYNNGKEC